MVCNVAYFLMIEIAQMKHDWPTYKKNFAVNMMRLFPIMSVFLTGVNSIFYIEEPLDSSENPVLVAIEAIGMLLLWYRCAYYLRIWDTSNYLVRMIIEVVLDMGPFFLIYIIAHLAFAEVFFFVS